MGSKLSGSVQYNRADRLGTHKSMYAQAFFEHSPWQAVMLTWIFPEECDIEREFPALLNVGCHVQLIHT